MGVSIIVTLGHNPDMEKIKVFWNPVMLKYKDRPEYEFLFVDNKEEGMTEAQQDQMFITPWYYVPTYETLIAIENLTPSTFLTPLCHETDSETGSHSEYRGQDFNRKIRINKDTGMYDIREYS